MLFIEMDRQYDAGKCMDVLMSTGMTAFIAACIFHDQLARLSQRKRMEKLQKLLAAPVKESDE